MWSSTARPGASCESGWNGRRWSSSRTRRRRWRSSAVPPRCCATANSTCSTHSKKRSSYMTTKLKVERFRIRRTAPVTPEAETVAAGAPVVDTDVTQPITDELRAIEAEGIGARQLRMARRVAEKYGLAATSDHDAVRLLRAKGIDPFQRRNVLGVVMADMKAG